MTNLRLTNIVGNTRGVLLVFVGICEHLMAFVGIVRHLQVFRTLQGIYRHLQAIVGNCKHLQPKYLERRLKSRKNIPKWDKSIHYWVQIGHLQPKNTHYSQDRDRSPQGLPEPSRAPNGTKVKPSYMATVNYELSHYCPRIMAKWNKACIGETSTFVHV